EAKPVVQPAQRLPGLEPGWDRPEPCQRRSWRLLGQKNRCRRTPPNTDIYAPPIAWLPLHVKTRLPSLNQLQLPQKGEEITRCDRPDERTSSFQDASRLGITATRSKITQ